MATSFWGSFAHTTTQGEPVRVRYIRTEVTNVSVVSIGTSTVGNSGKYGINGTFFDPSTKVLVGIAVQDGAAVRNGGTQNYYTRGTMYRLTNGTIGVQPVKQASAITGSISDLRWAIGGTSLFLNQSFASRDAFFTALSGENYSGIDGSSKRPRTAIGYNGTQST